MSPRRISWALRLYPAAWRKRCGAEFAAPLEDVGPGWRDSWAVAVAGGWVYRSPARCVSTAALKFDRRVE